MLFLATYFLALTPTDKAVATPAGKQVIGYVQDDPESATVAEDVDYAKLTCLNVAFVNPTDAQGNLAATAHLDALVTRAHQHHVRVLISIGGGFASEDKALKERYYDLVSAANRPMFVRKLTDFVAMHHLDGLDVDLEGPAINADYSAFVQALSLALKPKHRWLTAAVSAGNGGANIPNETLALLDYVNVMAYDATGPWNPNVPGQHASMDYFKECATYWQGRGVPKGRIVMGVPFYGYGFGPAFNQGGYVYREILDKYPGSENLDQVGNTIWYNGIPTLRAKTRYVRENGLGGIMIWALNHDVKGKLSLLSAIHDELKAK